MGYKLCGSSQTGQSHIDKGAVCQDSHYYGEGAGFAVSAVADGLGSSAHSDVASELAARGAAEFCLRNIRRGMAEREILGVIRASYGEVNFTIKRQAGNRLDDFDTTLTLAVFMDARVYFGHAGDSGIIALRRDGIFERVTEQQNGEGTGKERPVFPLASEAHWIFGIYPHPAKAIFLMTDGVWDRAVPPVLRGMKCEYDVAYLSYIYDNLKTRDGKSCNEWIEKEVRALEPNLINYDDKTLAAVIDASAKLTPQRPEYYKYPSRELWNKLLAKQEGELYPYRKRKLPQVLERARPPVQAPPPPRPEMRDPQRDILRLRLKRTRYLALAELIIIVILALSLFAPKKPPGEDIPEPSPTETSTPTPTDTEVETTTGTPTGTPAVTPTATPAELSPEPPPETSPETSPESEPEESEAPDSAGWEQEL